MTAEVMISLGVVEEFFSAVMKNAVPATNFLLAVTVSFLWTDNQPANADNGAISRGETSRRRFEWDGRSPNR